MQTNAAQLVGLQALAWLASDDERLAGFMAATGADPGTLRNKAEDPEFLGAVLDFLLMDDAWIMAFCDQHGLPYTAPQIARAALPGGEAQHWN